jgi:hypothetical protein
MNKEFISYEQALELKQLGFNEPCFGWYILEDDGAVPMLVPEKCPKQDIGLCLAPTFSQAFRWVREKYKIRFFIQYGMSDLGEFFKVIFPNEGQRTTSYDSYEEAELACLNKLIEIVKKNETRNN